MANRYALALAAVTLVSCGGGGDGDDNKTPQQLLEGFWSMDRPGTEPGTEACVYSMWFGSNGYYTEATICPLTQRYLGAEVDEGSYVADDAVIQFDPDATSCNVEGRDLSRPDAPYEASRETLKLIRPSGPIVLKRIPNSSGSGLEQRTGCWFGNGFSPFDVFPI